MTGVELVRGAMNENCLSKSQSEKREREGKKVDQVAICVDNNCTGMYARYVVEYQRVHTDREGKVDKRQGERGRRLGNIV